MVVVVGDFTMGGGRGGNDLGVGKERTKVGIRVSKRGGV